MVDCECFNAGFLSAIFGGLIVIRWFFVSSLKIAVASNLSSR